MKRKTLRILLCAAAMMLMVTVTAVPAFAAGDVAGAIEQTWNTAKSQIQTVVNNVSGGGYDTGHSVFCKGRNELFRVQKARAV